MKAVAKFADAVLGGADIVDEGILGAIKDADNVKALQSFEMPGRSSRGGPVLNTEKSRTKAAEYFRRNAESRHKGEKPTELFYDDEGTPFRTDKKGKNDDGSTIYSWRNQENKNQQNSELDAK